VEEARGNSDVGRQLLQQAEMARQDAFENWAVLACFLYSQYRLDFFDFD